MGVSPFEVEDLKRRIRKLKTLELGLRFNGEAKSEESLVWHRMFDLRENPTGNAKYTLTVLAAMSREEYKLVIDEYFALVYFEYYKENGITFAKAYDPSLLSQLGLPITAGEGDIKSMFRKLAKQYHPDTGGDAAKFIELMKVYELLIGR